MLSIKILMSYLLWEEENQLHLNVRQLLTLLCTNCQFCTFTDPDWFKHASSKRKTGDKVAVLLEKVVRILHAYTNSIKLGMLFASPLHSIALFKSFKLLTYLL